ncbi:MAG: hypothetical protein A2268_13850 [Candidatus Raymondbacteria bacterium RifOxyA12_full_50_37]|uniref:Mce/MlaD domain-containing protein n=1 Tax=Candidatus Raymondbacteria bacterium RIFOXYD12_FULL_49_13 TaxID=1817890 RepID=A0A1F7F4X3_UNCRA|nr:MAG: hypothetical protein A2248_00780 [Candidatus Raymondbacteria bacterium RIFOXYA2_FULL_49_16]OGJ91926.1 MAG: hypothetical protein A2268_13850 [Candidatus Raymondbacteria bacterium RifOxyA12_full_50_37]OGJ92841.1 MAG: hypothetical protein A2487_09720 [Candidatus Raymondbacteria bacterium RifOxyC12_full_50_8]OGJ95472.1 MAG: hypothetical protein A2453_05285 [Candidatus Raymondbacteria bacterium RIFOXYC2_FULL_50_21]OGK01628.1 MAG: hypothetical protein A2519_07290 [Candidatus Raymondbacteria b
MSISKLQRARLGVFMIGGAVCLFFFIAIPIGFKLVDKQKTYWASFEGESLSGLEQGAILKFHGVPVGKVDRISYDPANLLRVKVTFKIQEDFPVKTDMVAQTGAMGITGLKYVELLGGTNEAPGLPPGSAIPTKKSMMTTITGQAEVIMGKIELLLNHLNAITDPDTLKGIKRIVDNTAAISEDARQFFAVMRPDFVTIAGSFQNIIARVDSISRDVKSITGETNRSFGSGNMGRILASIDSTAQFMQQLSQDISFIVKQSREDITVSMENLRETLENANELSKVLAENPSLLLKGEQQKERETP